MKNATYAEKPQRSNQVGQRQADQVSRKVGRMEGWGESDPTSQNELAATAGTAPGRVLGNLPAEPGARALRQSAVLQMQRERGNAYLAQMVQSQPDERLVQRGTPVEPVEAVPAPVEAPSGAETAAGEPTPTEMSAGGSAVRVTPGGVEISGGMVNVDAAMTRFSGAVQSDTVIANSVVATNYTPGAGNVW